MAMMKQRRELLDDALCLIDEDLLAKTLARRPRDEGRGARKLIRVFGRQMPALLASVVAVGILLLCIAAIPGIIRMVRLLTGMTPPPPMPPAGGTVQTIAEETADHIHSWSPWVPWGDRHERHCQVMSCDKQEWESHTWQAVRMDEDGTYFCCLICNDEREESATSSILLPNVPIDNVVSMKLEYDSAEGNRVIHDAETIEAILTLLRNARYVPCDETNLVYGPKAKPMTIFYADGTVTELCTLSPALAVKGEDGCFYWQYLSVEDAERLNALLSLSARGTLMVNGDWIDCGEHAPFATGNALVSWQPTPSVTFLPLTVTLRALGADVSEVVNGEATVTYKGSTYRLSISEQTLVSTSSSENLLLLPDGLGKRMESRGDELMVDIHLLLGQALYAMDGNQRLWQSQVDYDYYSGSDVPTFAVSVWITDAHEHQYAIEPTDKDSHTIRCQVKGCPTEQIQLHAWTARERRENGTTIFRCRTCFSETEVSGDAVPLPQNLELESVEWLAVKDGEETTRISDSAVIADILGLIKAAAYIDMTEADWTLADSLFPRTCNLIVHYTDGHQAYLSYEKPYLAMFKGDMTTSYWFVMNETDAQVLETLLKGTR